MWRLRRAVGVGFAPFIATLANGMLSLLHSLVVGNRLLRLCGLVSTGAGLAYVGVSLTVDVADRRERIRAVGALVLVTLLLGIMLATGTAFAGDAIGVTFSACGVWVQTAPLAQAVRTPTTAAVVVRQALVQALTGGRTSTRHTDCVTLSLMLSVCGHVHYARSARSSAQASPTGCQSRLQFLHC